MIVISLRAAALLSEMRLISVFPSVLGWGWESRQGLDLGPFSPFAPELTDTGGLCLPEVRQATMGLPSSSGPFGILKDVLNLLSWYFSEGLKGWGCWCPK